MAQLTPNSMGELWCAFCGVLKRSDARICVARHLDSNKLPDGVKRLPPSRGVVDGTKITFRTSECEICGESVCSENLFQHVVRAHGSQSLPKGVTRATFVSGGLPGLGKRK